MSLHESNEQRCATAWMLCTCYWSLCWGYGAQPVPAHIRALSAISAVPPLAVCPLAFGHLLPQAQVLDDDIAPGAGAFAFALPSGDGDPAGCIPVFDAAT